MYMRLVSVLIAALAILTLWKASDYLDGGRGERVDVEVGRVDWMRDHDKALKISKDTGKPVFVLFQEVPGCIGCQDFGKTVLSNQALVTSIEEEFVPLLVYNNKFSDKALLKRYGEPSWNYQVIRFLNGEGKDIIPRKDKVWTLQPLAKRMSDVLVKLERPVSENLGLMAAGKQVSLPELKEAAFAMFCFWTGEMRFGGLDGVKTTEAGWLDRHEVTRVTYDPSIISTEALVKKAKSFDCARKVFLPTEDLAAYKNKEGLQFGELDDSYRIARKSDQKRQIQGTPFASLDLNSEQATKVNAWARVNQSKALSFLSKEQLAQLKR